MEKLQHPVRVETPNPIVACAWQQAVGDVQGEIRIMVQHLFHSWDNRDPKKCRDILFDAGTEEISFIEMLSAGIVLNLKAASLSRQEDVAHDGTAGAVLSGMKLRTSSQAG